MHGRRERRINIKDKWLKLCKKEGEKCAWKEEEEGINQQRKEGRKKGNK